MSDGGGNRSLDLSVPLASLLRRGTQLSFLGKAEIFVRLTRKIAFIAVGYLDSWEVYVK